MKRLLLILLMGVMGVGVFAQDDAPPSAPITPENVLTLTETLALGGHTFAVNGLAYNRDDTRLATASEDLSLRVWDMVAGEVVVEQFDHFSALSDVAFSPIEDVLITTSWDRSVKVYRLAGDELELLPSMQGLQHIVEAVAFSADGAWYGFVVGDGTASLIQFADADVRQLYTFDTLEMVDIAFAPEAVDEVYVAAVSSGFPDLGAYLIATDGRDAVPLDHGHAGMVTALAFSPIASETWTLATVGDDGMLRLHSVSPDWSTVGTLAEVVPDGDGWFTDVAYAPSGDLLAAGTLEGDVILVDVRDPSAPETLLTLRMDDVSAITALAFNHAGSQLAVAGDDFRVHVFESP